MKRAAFVDHSFKTKSKSNGFLVDLLKSEYQVDLFWDSSWNRGPGIDLNEIGSQDYDLVIFFQMLPESEAALEKAGIRNAVLLPMYDQCFWQPNREWQKVAGQKFINFSRNLHEKMAGMGIESLHVQYFCKPFEERQPVRSERLRGLFWQRYDLVNWNHISSLIKHSDFEKIHIHKAIDPPGYEFYPPTEYETRRYGITMTSWLESRAEFLAMMEQADVFFAPRKFEGIGMSVIEAMAMGRCVVAPDCPIMNEYIQHGRNGMLYNLEKLKPLDFSATGMIADNAAETVDKGYRRWLEDREKILAFCREPGPWLRRDARTVSPIQKKSFRSHLSKTGFARLYRKLRPPASGGAGRIG